MEDVYKLNPGNTLHVAKELTIKAIENHLITAMTDPEKTTNSIANSIKP